MRAAGRRVRPPPGVGAVRRGRARARPARWPASPAVPTVAARRSSAGPPSSTCGRPGASRASTELPALKQLRPAGRRQRRRPRRRHRATRGRATQSVIDDLGLTFPTLYDRERRAAAAVERINLPVTLFVDAPAAASRTSTTRRARRRRFEQLARAAPGGRGDRARDGGCPPAGGSRCSRGSPTPRRPTSPACPRPPTAGASAVLVLLGESAARRARRAGPAAGRDHAQPRRPARVPGRRGGSRRRRRGRDGAARGERGGRSESRHGRDRHRAADAVDPGERLPRHAGAGVVAGAAPGAVRWRWPRSRRSPGCRCPSWSIPRTGCGSGIRAGSSGRRSGRAACSIWGFTAGVLSTLLELGGWARPWPTDRIEDLPGTSAVPLR